MAACPNSVPRRRFEGLVKWVTPAISEKNYFAQSTAGLLFDMCRYRGVIHSRLQIWPIEAVATPMTGCG
jgi:hypothetical protein